MSEIFALVEHRQGTIRDITYELMSCGRKLAENANTKLTAVILGYNTDNIVQAVKKQAHRLLVVDSEMFKDFNSELYQNALSEIIKQQNPRLTLIGHSASGMDLCPALAVQVGVPFTTDCLDVEIIEQKLRVTRQMYDGKLNARVLLRENPGYMITLRSGCFPAGESSLEGNVENLDIAVSSQPDYRKFIEYIEAAIGDVDITKSDILVSIGRGVKEQVNIPVIEDFAATIGAVVSCSRPVVDAGWLAKDRQVGSSGKTVKPKLYIALGISGAFQHIVGMKSADTIIAVNKDPNAPIFNEADYGIVDDLFKVVPVLKTKILEMKQAKG
jgi:electron transfer flavoprotein alpha subunit